MYQLLEKWVLAHEGGAPKGCFYSWEMSLHAISANTPHPLLTTLLLLWAVSSFPSMCIPAEPNQCAKAFVTSPRICALLISLGTAACHANKCPSPKTVPPDCFQQKAHAVTHSRKVPPIRNQEVEAADTINKGNRLNV